MYARGILFGNMKYELGDHSVVRCPELGLSADVDFKTKGWVSGTYNAIGGTIKDDRTGQVLFELSGLWSEEMFVKDLRVGSPVNNVTSPLANKEYRTRIRICSSTPEKSSLRNRAFDHWRNKMSGSRKSCGIRRHRR